MSLVDRFICRREGHVPSLEVKGTSGITVTSWVTYCLRCGQVFEATQAAQATGEAAEGEAGQ